ncbi:MAG: hypothetical protein K2J46_00655, partial [Muribaculaceae bacterium]|nr:hypothetical protein [Muribaculaceae bacterium]
MGCVSKPYTPAIPVWQILRPSEYSLRNRAASSGCDRNASGSPLRMKRRPSLTVSHSRLRVPLLNGSRQSPAIPPSARAAFALGILSDKFYLKT